MKPEIGKYYVFVFSNTGIIGRCIGVEKTVVFFQTRFGILQRDSHFDRMAETPRPSLLTRLLKRI